MSKEVLDYKPKDLLDENSVRIIDILAQVKSLNEIIDLHKTENNDSFMLNQYLDMKNRFLEELKDLLFVYKVEILINKDDTPENDAEESIFAG